MSNHTILPNAISGLGEAFSLLPSATSIQSSSISLNKDDIKNDEYHNNIIDEDNKFDESSHNLLNLSDIRVAVLGNVDAGKSTIVGVLTTGILDNGRGEARKNVFLHPHEHLTGRTSTPSIEIIGFNNKMEQILPSNSNGKNNKNKGADVIKKSDYILNLIDLCGHEKYLKTTLYGLTALAPHYLMIIIGSNMGLSTVTKEYIALIIALNLPFFIVVSKIDISPPDVNQMTRKSIAKLLRNYNKIPYPIKNIEDSIKMAEIKGANRLVPIFPVSSVTGEGLESLKKYLSIIGNPYYNNDNNKDIATNNDNNNNNNEKNNNNYYDKIIKNYYNLLTTNNNSSNSTTTSTQNLTNNMKSNSKKDTTTITTTTTTNNNNNNSTKLSTKKSPSITSFSLTPPILPSIIFPIDSIYEIKGLGFILSGNLIKGEIKLGDYLYLGPDKINKFILISVKNIKIKNINKDILKEEQNGTILIKIINNHTKNNIKKNFFRKGMILGSGIPSTCNSTSTTITTSTVIPNSISNPHPNFSNYLPPLSSREFLAVIFILHHSTTISRGYQPVIHCGVIRQSATLVEVIKLVSNEEESDMSKEENENENHYIEERVESEQQSLSLSTGSRALVRFRFLYFNEVIIPNTSFIFREGKAKGVGKVIRGI